MDDYCLKCHTDAYQGLVPQRAPFQFVQQQAVSLQRARDPAGGAQTRRQREGRALVRRLSRRRAVLQRRIRRSEFRRREPSHLAGRHHLHGLPRHHPRQQHAAATPTTPSTSRSIIRSPTARIASCNTSTSSWSRPSRSFTRRPFSSRSCARRSSAPPATRSAFPQELNHYKEFLRGQNHYDTYLLSGVSGHGARSFYYPEKAKQNCAGCHMPLKESQDFGAKFFNPTNTVRALHSRPSVSRRPTPASRSFAASRTSIKAHEDFLKGSVRVDIFGIKEGGAIDGPLTAPLRPQSAGAQARPALSARSGAAHAESSAIRSPRARWIRTKSGWTQE